MSFLVVFRASPDVDHLAPVAWKLLAEGEEVHAVVSTPYDVDADHRIALLRRSERFHLHHLWPQGRATRRARLAGRWRATVPYALWLLRRHRVRLVAVEWGYGLAAGYDRLASPAGLLAVARSVAGSFRRSTDPQQPRHSLVVAARLRRVPTVCLPHGLSVKLDADTNPENAAALQAGGLDWRDRNRFAAYVLNTEHHRRIHLDHARGDPEVMQTWGSVRWSPEWFAVNRDAAPPFRWPDGAGDRVRVVLMVPKWVNRVDAPATVELVRRLHALDEISLAIQAHPRSIGDPHDPLRAAGGLDWDRIHDLTGLQSVSVIREADVVLDIGSSIGLEVVLQGKVLVNPAYLHELRTLFDDVDGVAVPAAGPDDVVAYLRRHAAGEPHVVPEAALAELLRRAVYGEREPFDVLGLYSGRLRELAGTRG